MTCPICDQKPMNCDCSPRERAMYMELQEREDTPFTLTDAEREAVEWALKEAVWSYNPDCGDHPDTLRGLLERLA